MALRELLSSSQREALEVIPVDRAGLIEHCVLSDQDLSLIRRRPGAQTAWVLPFSTERLRQIEFETTTQGRHSFSMPEAVVKGELRPLRNPVDDPD
jgi:hypothetical protein